jgi:hypothetical protein
MEKENERAGRRSGWNDMDRKEKTIECIVKKEGGLKLKNVKTTCRIRTYRQIYYICHIAYLLT